MVPVANLKSQIDWTKDTDSFRSLIIDKLEKWAGLTDFKKHIRYDKMVTPLDWQEEYRVGYGATFNLGHNLGQMLIFRHHNKFEEFDNMWLAVEEKILKKEFGQKYIDYTEKTKKIIPYIY